ncbi:MAG: hypothetical protein M3511_08900 [Deinococcota bacterium]|nr:hypothetical protein [Deinococcota bacterium]
MPRVCTICNHEARDKIDAALLAGEALRDIAGHFSVSKSALSRHAEHLPAHLIKAQEAAEVAQADSLLEQVKSLQSRALVILDKAEAAGDLRTALSAIREARGNLKLLAKLLGELQQEGTVNITISPEWLELRALIVQAVKPYPDAKQAILGSLSEH